MQAIVLEANEKLNLIDFPKPIAKSGEAVIKVQAASLNHRDQWSRIGLYPNLKYPSILGSDGCGIVESVGSQDDNHWINESVIINPNVNWGDNPAFQSLNYTILGMPTNGTLAEYVCVPINRLHKKPAHLSIEEASALPLAALTAFRAVFTKGETTKNKNILITGIGGGVAQFAMQFALAVGAKVFITSGDEEKLEKALKLGAFFGVNYKTEGWEKQLQKHCPFGFDVIIDGAGGDGFGKLAKMVAQGANFVIYGGTSGTPSPINLPRLFFAQANIKGTTMGNDDEFSQMISFVNDYKIKPLISSVRPLSEAISAFDEMHEGKQFGKLVITIP
ncbi:MAG: alcohol dehydrogenase [Bacteroidetes bacterium]|nr:MAG: alcohol dehydrogenase [Bacteroidota bacterium]TAG90304.1 MAG: alcohol dehydrogenase [Bacteroidota bacterium]